MSRTGMPDDGDKPRFFCRTCGYDIKGLRVDERCPECGNWVLEPHAAPTISGKAIAALVLSVFSLLGALLVLPGLVLGGLALWLCVEGHKAIERGEASRGDYAFLGPAQVLAGLGVVASTLIAMVVLGMMQ